MARYEISKRFWNSGTWPKWLDDRSGLQKAHTAFLKAEADFRRQPTIGKLLGLGVAMRKVTAARTATIAAHRRPSPEMKDLLKLLRTGQKVETDKMAELRARLASSIEERCAEVDLKQLTKLATYGLKVTGKLMASGQTDEKALAPAAPLARRYGEAQKLLTGLQKIQPQLGKVCPAAVVHVKDLRTGVEKLRPAVTEYTRRLAALANIPGLV